MPSWTPPKPSQPRARTSPWRLPLPCRRKCKISISCSPNSRTIPSTCCPNHAIPATAWSSSAGPCATPATATPVIPRFPPPIRISASSWTMTSRWRPPRPPPSNSSIPTSCRCRWTRSAPASATCGARPWTWTASTASQRPATERKCGSATSRRPAARPSLSCGLPARAMTTMSPAKAGARTSNTTVPPCSATPATTRTPSSPRCRSPS